MAGDQVAPVGLLEAARPDIRRYARSTCRASDVDDAVQETFRLPYRRVGKLRMISSISAWLFAVVRHECLRLSRGSRPGTAVAVEELDERAFLSGSDQAARLDLAAAIQSLPAHYRTIVIVRDLEERNVDEMTAALGSTREAVEGRLHRARTLLREYSLR